VRRQLTGRGTSLWRRNDADLAKPSELFRSYWTAAQDIDLTVVHSDNRRFNAVRRRASINDQGDASVKFVKNVLGSRGADPAELICAWRGKRFPERGNDFSENGM